ncbi:MAG: MMPL family transporter [Gaiellales bacterium]
MESLIATVSGAAVRRRRWFVAAWILLLLVALPFSGKAQSVLSSGGFDVPGSQSEKVIDYLNSQPGGGAYAFTFLIAAPTAQEAAAREAQVRSDVAKQFPQVRMRSDVAVSPDRTTVALTGYARVDQNKSLELSRQLKDGLQVTDGPTRTFLLGASANYATFQQITEDDLRQAEALSSPVILIVLLVLFGAVVAALLPALLGLFSVVITFAAVYAVASATEVSVYATTMVTMIGIGVAVDYSMFVLARFRDELEDGAVVETAVATAMRTSGTAVVFSGITVIVSLASIWIVPVRAVQSMALAAIMVVAVTIAGTLTLLPALLAIVGRSVNRGRIGRRRSTSPASSGFWQRWTAGVMRRPLLCFVGAAALLIALTIPALSMVTQNRALEQLPRSTDVRVGTELLTSRITGVGQGREGSIDVLVRPAGGSADELARRITAKLGDDPLITKATVEPVAGGLLVVGYLGVDPESSQAVDVLVPRVRTMVAHEAAGSRGVEADVDGVSAFNHDLNEEVGGDLWKVMGLVLVLCYLVLLVLLRSVLLPLKAVIMNLLSIGAAYGVIVMVFQWGWLDFTGYHSLGHINTLNPALMLAITFGLAMDYEVFLLSRIRERYAETGDNARAVEEGLASSARIITSAALIMTTVFASFALTGVPAIKEIGLGLAVAIFIDATVTRLVLVPAAMRLLGEWNWWMPDWLDRILPHVAYERPVSVRHA